MRKILRLTAIVLVVAATGMWAATGANRGFTVNNQPRKILDPVTGLEGTAYDKVFIPGMDFLGAAAVAAALLAGASFLFRKRIEPKR